MASSKRERELARAKYERQQARRAAAARSRRSGLIALAGVAILAVVIGGIAWATARSASNSASAGGSGDTVTCTWTAQGTAARPVEQPPTTAPKQPATQPVTLVLTQGSLGVELERAKAPCTVANFLHLAGSGFYSNTPCHRLTTAATLKVLQCGDPTGRGDGGPGYTIPDENLTGATYPAGTVAMANTGAPNSGGSQFFLVYADSQLPPSYTPFGRITSGLPVLTGIAAKGVKGGGQDGAPAQPVILKTVAVAGG